MFYTLSDSSCYIWYMLVQLETFFLLSINQLSFSVYGISVNVQFDVLWPSLKKGREFRLLTHSLSTMHITVVNMFVDRSNIKLFAWIADPESTSSLFILFSVLLSNSSIIMLSDLFQVITDRGHWIKKSPCDSRRMQSVGQCKQLFVMQKH